MDGGSIDRNSGLSAGLKGGQGNMDAQRGLNEGFDGGIGENEYQGSGFDAGPKGSGNGGGVTLDGGDGGDVDQYGEQAGGLKQKMKGELIRLLKCNYHLACEWANH